MCKDMSKHSPGKSKRLRSYLGFILIYSNVCPQTFTAPRKIPCVLLSNTSLRGAEELARPVRPELLSDQICDFVWSVADCPTDEESDDRDRHGEHLRRGPKRQHQRQQEHSISIKSWRVTKNGARPQAHRINTNLHPHDLRFEYDKQYSKLKENKSRRPGQGFGSEPSLAQPRPLVGLAPFSDLFISHYFT